MKTVPSSSTSCSRLHSSHTICIIRILLRIATAILGASGYSGQETLDRVLAHPELELVALGSDSLAGQPASALDPRLERAPARRSSRTTRRSQRAPSSSSAASTTSAQPRSSRPPAPSSSTSPARTGSRTRPSIREWYGFEHRAPDGSRRVVVRAPGALPAEGPPDREPRLLRDRRRCSRSRRSPRRSTRTASWSTRSRASPGAGRTLKPTSHAAAVLENVVAVPGRRAPARAGARAGARLPRLLRAAPAAGPARAARHLLRPRRPRTICATLLEAAYATAPVVTRAAGRGSRPSSRASRGPTRAEIGVFTDRSTGTRDRRLRARQPRQGRGRPGGAEREPRARARRDGRAAARRSARMSVTAAKGFVAAGVHAGIRQTRAGSRASSARACPRSARRCSRVNQVLAAPVVVSKAHLDGRRAAGDRRQLRRRERRDRRARRAGRDRDGRRGRPAARPRRGGGARPLDRRDRAAAAAATRCVAGLPRRPPALSRRGGADAADAILTTDTRPKQAAVSLDGFTVGGMAKGSGDDPPAARDDARGRHDRLPARAGRGDRLPPPGGRRELQLDLGRRRVLDERRRLPARERRQRDRAHAGDGRSRFGARARRGSAPTSPSRSSPTARARPCSPRSRSPAPPTARRRARSPPGSRPRRSSRPRSSATTRTGAACSPRPARRRTTAASRTSTPARVTLAYNGDTVLDRGTPQRRRAGRLERRLPDRARPRDRRRRGALPHERPLLRLRPHQRGLQDMSAHRRQGRRRGRRGRGRRSCAGSRREQRGLRRPRRGRADLGGDGAARARRSSFVGGRRVTTRRGARRRPRVARGGQRGALRRDRPARGAARGRRDRPAGDARAGARARRRGAADRARAAVVDALARGPSRSSRRSREGPLNVNADDAAAALAVGIGADRILFVTDVPGLLLGGAVSASIGVARGGAPARRGRAQRRDRARSCAPRSARRASGVQAEIGETAVVA